MEFDADDVIVAGPLGARGADVSLDRGVVDASSRVAIAGTRGAHRVVRAGGGRPPERQGVMTTREARIVENFMGTLAGQTLDEALANAELDAKSYGLSRGAARELGAKVRQHFAKNAGRL